MRTKIHSAFVAIAICIACLSHPPARAATAYSAADLETLADDTEEIIATGLKDADMPALRKFNSLRALTLKGSQEKYGAIEISGAGLLQLSKIASLESLNLRWNAFADQDVEALLRLKKLAHLDLGFSANLSDAGLKTLSGIVQLESLNLSDSPKITDEGVRALAAMRHLRVLNLNQYSNGLLLTDAALTAISALPELESLDIFPRTPFTPEGLKELGKLGKLKSLNLRNQPFDPVISEILTLTSLSGVRMARDDDFERLGKLKKLHVLDVYGAFTGSGLRHLGALPELEVLLIDSTLITDEGMLELSKLKRLEMLTISHANRLSDAALAYIAELKLLHKLSLMSCRRITQKGIADLKIAMPECEIKTYRCGDVDARSFET